MNLSNNSKLVLEKIIKCLEVRDYMSLVDWSNEYGYIPSEAGSESGRYKMGKTPYLIPIAEALSKNSSYKEIVFMKSSQVGATQLSLMFLMYAAEYLKGSVVYMLPTETMCDTFSKTKVQPTIEATPIILDIIGSQTSRNSNNTTLYKKFPNCFWKFVNAQTPNSYSSVSIPYFVADEYERYPRNVGGEGDPKSIIMNRVVTFQDHKVFFISTPGEKEGSLIEKEFLKTDQNKLFVPCPDCNEKQELVFENLEWDKEITNPAKIQDVKYACCYCGSLIDHKFKAWMVSNGEFRPTCVENISSEKIGFHVNSLYSTLGNFNWDSVVKKYLEAKQGGSSEYDLAPTNSMQGFYNTILGLTYEDTEKTERMDYNNLQLIKSQESKYYNNEIPDDVIYITIGGDVQRDRAEFEIKGWANNAVTNYSIDYRVLYFDTTSINAWNENFGSMFNEFSGRKTKSGNPIMCIGAFIDSGGHDWTATVYNYCDTLNMYLIRKGLKHFVYPIKGDSKSYKENSYSKKPFVQLSSTRLSNVEQNNEKYQDKEISFYMLDTYQIKNKILLEISESGKWNFPKDREETYYKMLCSEERVKTFNPKTGFEEYHYKRKYRKNEAFDCNVYAFAANIFIRKMYLNDKTIA